MRLLRLELGFAALLALASCGGGGSGAGDASPGLTLKTPPVVVSGASVTFSAKVSGPSEVSSVVFVVNGVMIGTDDTPPFALAFTPSGTPGTEFVVKAVGTLAEGGTLASDPSKSVIGFGGAAEIKVGAPAEVDPGIYRVDFQLFGEAGEKFTVPTLSWSSDGGDTIHPATIVGGSLPATLTASPGGTGCFLEWSAAADVGLADVPGVRLSVALLDPAGVWRAGSSAKFAVQNAGVVSDFRSRLFPDFSDIVDQASPRFANVIASAVTTVAAPGILKTDFAFDSSWFPGSGNPSSLCAGCPSWKKDAWPDVSASLYVAQGENPTHFVILDVFGGGGTIWNPSFATLFPEFNDGTITGAGDPSQSDAGSFDECVAKTVRDLHVGVVVGNWIQAGPVPAGAPGLTVVSLGQALQTGEPRWNIFVGMAQAQMRAITAVEILRDAAPGSLRFVVAGASKDSWSGAIAAAADPRIAGAALYDGADIGRWSLLGETALDLMTPFLQSTWDEASVQLLAAGYPMSILFDHVGMAQIPGDPKGASFSKYADPARQIALGALQGKIYLLQAGTADHVSDVHLRATWFDGELRRRYPGPLLRMCNGANADHSSVGPQALKNLRALPATVFYGRPRCDVTLEATTGPGPVATLRAKVSNPNPSAIAVVRVSLYVADDDDGDFRVFGLPTPTCTADACCTKPESPSLVNCFFSTSFFLNRRWKSMPMAPTGVPGEYVAFVDPQTIGAAWTPFVAAFAEVEDRAIPGVFPAISGENRGCASSAFVFAMKN